MDTLPTEILDNICAILSRPDLKRSRLVCKTFTSTAEKHLYHTIIVYPNIDSLYRARCISERRRLKIYVKKLLYKCLGIPSVYTFDKWRKYYLGHGWLDKDQKLEFEKLFDSAALKHHYWQYKTFDHGQDLADEVETIYPLLKAITRCPRLSEFEFSYAEDDYCPVESRNGTFDALSTFKSADRLTRNILAIPTPGWGDVTVREHMLTLLKCWKDSVTTFKGRDLPWELFKPNIGENLNNLPFMLSMTNIVFQIQMQEGPLEQVLRCRQIGWLVSGAPALQSLELSFNELPIKSEAKKLNHIFSREHYWPCLRRLRLQAVSTTNQHLRVFLTRHHDTLRWLELKDIILREDLIRSAGRVKIEHGSWIDNIKFLQRKFNLEHVRLGGSLTNCWDEAWEGRCPEDTPLSDTTQNYMKERIETFIVHGDRYPLADFESVDKRKWGWVATDPTWLFEQAKLERFRTIYYPDLPRNPQIMHTAAANPLLSDVKNPRGPAHAAFRFLILFLVTAIATTNQTTLPTRQSKAHLDPRVVSNDVDHQSFTFFNTSEGILETTRCGFASMSITAPMCTVVLDRLPRSPGFTNVRRWNYRSRDPRRIISWNAAYNRCMISLTVADPQARITDTFSLREVFDSANSVISECVRIGRTGRATVGHDRGFEVEVVTANLA
ncbi:MAG: hypothetical protein Q9167_006282 [Letrouitia subvulpina]